MLNLSAASQARAIRDRRISSLELVSLHLARIAEINPAINAVTELLADSALQSARAADAQLAAGSPCGPLHGVPVSIKDSIDVAGTKCTAGTLSRRDAPPAHRDATLVARLRAAGAIPVAKTNLPDMLWAYESDNFIYGRSNNPYDLARTPGGSSGGESALIAACGSPLGLGSDAAGSVRLPAAFCGIASIKPTSGRLPRTGHVPPSGSWIEAIWQMGPMARYTEDLVLAMTLVAGEDDADFTSPPVPLLAPTPPKQIAFFTDNGFARCSTEIEEAVRRCATFFARQGIEVEEQRPPGVDQAYAIELSLLGADGGLGISDEVLDSGELGLHPLTVNGFLRRMTPYKGTAVELAAHWARWDAYRADLRQFFERYDAILCPVYTQPALKHGESVKPGNFEGFSYTMAWNVAGAPAATVRCATSAEGLPINAQVVTKPWRDLLALDLCRAIEQEFGGWQMPTAISAPAAIASPEQT